MKSILALLALVLCSCGTTQLTPEQAKQYADLAHSVVGNGIQDYKEIKPLVNQ